MIKSGDIVLIDFPFSIPAQSKVRPAVVITRTKDKFQDVIICAISSAVPKRIADREISIRKNDPAFSKTGLRVDSVIKIDRIATLRQTDIITKIGSCTPELWNHIVKIFCSLPE